MQARNLELQAPIVRDGHELRVAWPPQQSMVRTSKIHHLKVKVLLSEVSRIPEHDREPDASERSGLGFEDDPEEGCPARSEVLL